MLLLNLIGYSQVLELPQKIDTNNQIVQHQGYILSYNEGCEQANWVKYMVTKADLENKVAKRSNNFKEDTLIKTGSATLDDYYKSGYDRGHLAPSLDFMHNQDLNDESFYMSNMSPQNPSFNRGMWKKLENYVRDLAIDRDTVYVITGPILSDTIETIGNNHVCVPKSYYKIIIDSKGFVIACYIMENRKLTGQLEDYLQPIENVETATGLMFQY